MKGAAKEPDVGEQHQAVRDHHALVAELPWRKGQADYDVAPYDRFSPADNRSIRTLANASVSPIIHFDFSGRVHWGNNV